MFRISRRADYAVRTLLELAASEGNLLTAPETARRGGIPLPFLRKITPQLASAGLVTTKPGHGGGLSLARPAVEISLLDAIEAVEGPVCLNVCLLRPSECPRDQICPAHTFWERLQAIVVEEMRSANLASLAAEYRSLLRNPRPRPGAAQHHVLPILTSPSSADAEEQARILVKE